MTSGDMEYLVPMEHLPFGRFLVQCARRSQVSADKEEKNSMLSSLEQILLLMLALNKPEMRIDTMHRHMAWFMLPDGIEEYIPNRQISHFETSPDGDVSWMRYPGEIALREMNGDVAELVVEHQLAGPNPAPVLPGPISLEVFDRLNYGHRWFRTIRAHLLQDQACQEVLSKLVDTSRKDEDRYKVYGGLMRPRP